MDDFVPTAIGIMFILLGVGGCKALSSYGTSLRIDSANKQLESAVIKKELEVNRELIRRTLWKCEKNDLSN